MRPQSSTHNERRPRARNRAKPILASRSAGKHLRLYNYTLFPYPTPVCQHFAHHDRPDEASKTVRAVTLRQTSATASSDSNIGLWARAQEGGSDEESALGLTGEWECMSVFEGHETGCMGVAYSSSASGSRDETVWI